MESKMNKTVSVGLGLFFLMLLAIVPSTALASSVVLKWDANTEPDIAGYKVYYKANSAELPFDGAGAIEGVAPIDVNAQTTATITGLDPNADYYFAITAYNTAGMESPYSNVVAVQGIQDITPPTVSLTSPTGGGSVSGVVAITATATDDTGITKIEVYENNNLIAAGNLSPYSYNWNTAALQNGAYTITAKAYDAAGNVASTSTDVSVMNDTAAPSVSIASPTAGGTVTGTVSVAANATDNVGIAKVEFYVNGVLKGSDTAAPYNFSWNSTTMANGSYTLTAKAYDAAGNVSESAGVSVKVSNAITTDTTPPTVTILAPTASYLYSSSVTISASATDNVRVTKVEVYVDNALKFTTTSNSVNFRSSITKGVHTIAVKAYDASNNVNVASKTVNRFL